MEKTAKKSKGLFSEVSKYYIGGAKAGARFFPAIVRPLNLERADGAYFFDIDGNMYNDYHSFK